MCFKCVLNIGGTTQFEVYQVLNKRQLFDACMISRVSFTSGNKNTSALVRSRFQTCKDAESIEYVGTLKKE